MLVIIRAFEGRGFVGLEPVVACMGAAIGPGASEGLGALVGVVFASSVEPDGVVDDVVHDAVGFHGGVEAGVPVLFRVLGAEHGGSGVVAPFDEFEEHDTSVIQEPFVDHQQREYCVFA